MHRLPDLERENGQPKRPLAEREMEVDSMRALFRKNGLALPKDAGECGF